jgi:uncharacterized membrane protein YsdA (DUF1294 family)
MFLFTFSAFALNIAMPSIPVIAWYFGSINLFTLILFGIDKLNSAKDRKRVPELSFHFFSLIGGVIGLLLGVILFRHKLNSKYFLLIQLALFIFWLAALYFIFKNLDVIIAWGQSISG